MKFMRRNYLTLGSSLIRQCIFYCNNPWPSN